MEIRSATADDFPSFAVLSTELGMQHHGAHPKIFTPDLPSEELFRATLTDPACDTLLCIDDGQVAGYLTYQIVEQPRSEYFYAQHDLYIVEMSVGQRHRRKGCGELLMNHAVEVAKAQGIKRVTLRVWSFNEGAIAFYERVGFTPQAVYMAREV